MSILIADKKLRQERLSKCESCPFKKDNKCGKCGCILKLKITYKKSKCPINKW